jgi:hypothetical protein
MADEKSDKLGLRGRLAHIESTLRLLGGANATAALAAGAALHAFENNAYVLGTLKVVAALFLLGVFAFVVSYVGLFTATHDIDHSLYKESEPTWPEYLWWRPLKTAEGYRKAALREFAISALGALVSFIVFVSGLGIILSLAARLALGVEPK